MSAEVSALTPPPQADLLQMAMGFMNSFLLRAASQLRLADHLADGAKTADEIAAIDNFNAPALYRLLRSLAAIGIFSEDASHRFSLTPLSEPLRSNVPGSVRTSILSLTGDLFVIPWSKLLHSVTTGKPSFDHHYGRPFFDHLSSNAEEAAWFTDLLIGINAADAPAVADAYDFSLFTNIVDVGGATGHMLTTILASHPDPLGTVFDLPHNEAAALELIRARGMTERVSYMSGSFFEAIPAGFNLYLMSHIIHDWSEDQCLSILGNIRRAMAPTGRLILIEMVLSEGNSFHPGKILDISMLTMAGGQERSEDEYRTMLKKAGFRLTRVIPTNSPVSIIEAMPA
jgi:hypothetical protein